MLIQHAGCRCCSCVHKPTEQLGNRAPCIHVPHTQCIHDGFGRFLTTGPSTQPARAVTSKQHRCTGNKHGRRSTVASAAAARPTAIVLCDAVLFWFLKRLNRATMNSEGTRTGAHKRYLELLKADSSASWSSSSTIHAVAMQCATYGSFVLRVWPLCA